MVAKDVGSQSQFARTRSPRGDSPIVRITPWRKKEGLSLVKSSGGKTARSAQTQYLRALFRLDVSAKIDFSKNCLTWRPT